MLWGAGTPVWTSAHIRRATFARPRYVRQRTFKSP